MNEFRICDRCKATNCKTLVPKLKKIDSQANIIIGCQNVCGIGRFQSFAIVNHRLLVAENEEELLEKIRVFIKEKN